MIKNFARTIVIGCLVLSLQNCKTDEPALYNPSIKSIAFVGLPSEDVELNQTSRTITITMPTVAADLKLKPTIEFTPHTKLEDGLLPNGTLDLSSYCPCQDVSVVPEGRLAGKITLRNTADNGQETYLVLLKAGGPLVIKDSGSPIEISFDKPSRVFLPAENYYGSRGVYGISLAEMGSANYNFMSADGGCMSICDQSGQHPNQIGVSLDAYKPALLKPGKYDLRLRLAGGEIIKYPPPIVVK